MSTPESQLEEIIISKASYKNKDGSYNKLRHPKVDEEDPMSVDVSIPPIPESEIPDIDTLLRYAVKDGASDVHLVAGTYPKYRIDGELVPIPGYGRLLTTTTRRILEPLLDEETSEMFDKDGDLDFAYSQPNLGRFRVNMYKQRGSWSGVFRQLSSSIPSPDKLGLPRSITDLVKHKRGIVLVTGPTGSGKSTTLASLIDIINTNYKKNIITLEDPIEYLHRHKMSNVSQREMGVDSKNFASALRASLREDPDVILVGEMRDYETISTAITAAETGHLVFSTLHTIGAASTIDRIIDTYPAAQQQQARSQLALCFQGIISQQLVPRIGGGRVAALEIMLGTDALRSLVREGKTGQILSYIQTSKQLGMQSMDSHLLELNYKGLITEEDAINFAVDKKYVKQQLNYFEP